MSAKKWLRASVGALVFLWSAPLLAAQYALQVNGLACPFCAYGIEKRLRSIEKVTGVQTDIERGRVIVTTAEGTSLDQAAAERAVKEAGFTLAGFERLEAGGEPE